MKCKFVEGRDLQTIIAYSHHQALQDTNCGPPYQMCTDRERLRRSPARRGAMFRRDGSNVESTSRPVMLSLVKVTALPLIILLVVCVLRVLPQRSLGGPNANELLSALTAADASGSQVVTEDTVAWT
eukprot:IDg12454t1